MLHYLHRYICILSVFIYVYGQLSAIKNLYTVDKILQTHYMRISIVTIIVIDYNELIKHFRNCIATLPTLYLPEIVISDERNKVAAVYISYLVQCLECSSVMCAVPLQ